MTTTEPAPRPTHLDDVPGWFQRLDQQLFDFFLRETQDTPGDLLEMGCYLGKATIVMGRHLREDEMLTVCDLFADEANGNYTREDTSDFYRKTLSRQAFENNYLAFHEELPQIVEGRTSVLADLVDQDSCRFVHIDASHMYDDVSGDIDTTRKALRPGGIVALDDYRTEHTPGVSAAVWEAVFTKGMRPVCVSGVKMYATWGDPEPYRERLRAWAAEVPNCVVDDQLIDGEVVLRLKLKPPATKVPGTRPAQAAAPGRPAATLPPPKPRGPLLKRLAVDLLPPVVTRALRRKRRG